MDDEQEVKRAKQQELDELFLFVEREIWAKAEEKWRFPSTQGFAEQAVELGYCSTTAEGKRAIRDILLTREFSLDRVLAHYHAPQLDLVQTLLHLEQELGESSQVFSRFDLLASKLFALKRDGGEGGETLPNLLTERFSQMDSPQMFNFDGRRSVALSFTNVRRAMALLNSETTQFTPKQLEKQLQSLCPLTYTVFTNRNLFHLRKAMVDLMELAKLSIVLAAKEVPTFVALPSNSKDVYLVRHLKHRLMRPPTSSGTAKLIAVCSFTTLHAAASAIVLGYPLPEAGNVITLTVEPSARALVWIAYQVLESGRHCQIKTVQEEDEDENLLDPVCKEEIERFAGNNSRFAQPGTLIKMKEAHAMTPIAIGFV